MNIKFIFLLFLVLLASVGLGVLFERNQESPDRKLAQSQTYSTPTNDPSRIFQEAYQRAGSTSNSDIMREVEIGLAALPSKSDRVQALNDPILFSFYLRNNAYDGNTKPESLQKVLWAIEASDIYNTNLKINDQLINKAEYLLRDTGAEELEGLIAGGFDLTQVDPNILKDILEKADPYSKQKLRDLFGNLLNSSPGDYNEINAPQSGATPVQIQSISEGLKEIVESSEGAKICFGDFASDTITTDTIHFCHETYKFFDKVYGEQRAQALDQTNEALGELKKQWSFAVNDCGVQINFSSDRIGRPFAQDVEGVKATNEKDQKSTVLYSLKKRNKDRTFNFEKQKLVGLKDVYDFAKKACPGYISIFDKQKGVEDVTPLGKKINKERETIVYNVSFEKFECWERPSPIQCILDSSGEGRLDTVPPLQDSGR